MSAPDFDPFRYRISPPLELNKAQEKVFVSILDTFVPCLPKNQEDALVEKLNETHTEKQVRNFCRVSSSSLGTIKTVLAMINRTALPEKRTEFATLLSTLTTPAGMLQLTGQSAEFENLSSREWEKILLHWKRSALPELRSIYLTFRGLALFPVYLTGLKDLNEAMHYDLENKVYNELPTRLSMMQTSENLHFDVIVIGSGAGGGVVASQLAKSGKSVLVIEKGKYYHESEFMANEQHGYTNLYEHGGVASTLDGTISLVAGSVFGGGTTVNWSASLKPRYFVREEWASRGLLHFSSSKFSKDLDIVCQRIGVTTEGIEHNGSSNMLMAGCKALGYNVSNIPQNTSGKKHTCGFCFHGCRGGIKNGTMNTWLRDAHQHGAKFLDQTKVQRVIIKNGKAVGVECLVHYNHSICIKAGRVVVSAGSLQSPGILLKSGLQNKNIGQHLRLHPAVTLLGFFDKKIGAFKGDLLTCLSDVAENVEDGYGCNIEGFSPQPSLFSSYVDWRNAADHKEYMMRFEQCASVVILARDKDSIGSVEYDKDENVVTRYILSEHDRRSIVEGLIRAANIMVAAGAREVITAQIGVDFFKFEANEESSVNNPRFLTWIERLKEYGLPDHSASIISAHQMGSNRMGISPKTSVVKPTGETWEVKNLYVADASVFPTASGVNPMVTIEAVALHIADSILNYAKPKL